MKCAEVEIIWTPNYKISMGPRLVQFMSKVLKCFTSSISWMMQEAMRRILCPQIIMCLKRLGGV